MRPQSCGVLLLIALFVSCNHSGDHTNAEKSAGVPVPLAGKAMGLYTGNFNKGLIALEINYISGKNVSGYDVHKGLRRNVNGLVTQNGGQLDFVLKEPGDNPFDGTFYLSLDTVSLTMKGKWVPADSSKVRSKALALTRKADSVNMMDEIWTSAGGGDTTLTFSNNGTCELAFYEASHDSAGRVHDSAEHVHDSAKGPGDSTASVTTELPASTSQQIKVRGNFDIKADTFRIEWQQNKYISSPSLKLVITHVKNKTSDGDEYETLYLRGQGWDFVTLEGD